MTEKTRSISISSSSNISAPILISCPTLTTSSASPTLPSTGAAGSGSSAGPHVVLGFFNGSGILSGIHETENDSEPELSISGVGGGGGAGESNSIMNSSQISNASNDSVSVTKTNLNFTHNIAAGSSICRFPKLEECAHFHYERVQLGSIAVRLADDKSEFLNTSSIASQSITGGDGSQQQQNRPFNPTSCWFIIKVLSTRSDPFLIRRSFDNISMLDEMLHRCVYDRKISGLKDLSQLELKNDEEVDYAVAKYLERFSKIASDSLTCGTVLTWFQLDNKGRRLPLADTDTMRTINTPAVGAAYGVRRYVAQACDEISIEVGDMISVIDMPSPAESVWWRGKKSHLQKSHYEVGFFPQSCVATIGDKVPRHFPLPAPLVGQLDVSPTKPVLRKHGKLIAFFRSFILSRPSRRRLKQSGIYRERVFSCDLSEHLLNSGQEIPMVLKYCAEFIEENGIVDGIYRLSGITSNIQKLRRAFDEERVPDLTHPEIKQDIHAVSSLLKMYFRELPNPLCTYQLYDNFVEAIQTKSDSNERLRLMKETVLKLPPPHYRTLKYLATHLSKISRHSASTGMTDKNLAIVWAPNLLRSPALESGGVAALRGVGVQAVVTEYLIRNCDLIFDPNDDIYHRTGYDQRMDSLTDCESLLVEQREHDQSLSLVERPKSLSVGGPKLISLEEAQERHSRVDSFDINKSIPINTPPVNVGSYIEVGGGPSSLPDKYHTVLPVPRSWQKRKTHSWKSLFSRNPRNSSSNNDIKAVNAIPSSVQKEVNESSVCGNVDISDAEAIEIEKHRTITAIAQQKPKSIDLFESKPMDVCVRSNSVDSLRTAGHSRSVSHDSYFDLLQSPLRGVPACPSRELSELGLNFDREEPEMRIFSESESLVSSPKVGKENIPPSRRVLRARPEEFSSTTNSVNPSPKKQPRLNLLSPTEPPAWANCIQEHQNDESCCKRYKLEDQLSDIQFIDCSTPEHAISNANTIYASVQVHNPPSTTLSKSSSFVEEVVETMKNSTTFEAIFGNQRKNKDNQQQQICGRYSYPVQLQGKRKENDSGTKERFSYPGSGVSHICSGKDRDNKYACRTVQAPEVKMIDGEECKRDSINMGQSNKFPVKVEITRPSSIRYSYCEPTSLPFDATTPTNQDFAIHRSNSAEMMKNKKEMERSKLSVATPSSPVQSPRYSLLVGDTSSENSSSANTPIYDPDLTAQLMMGSFNDPNGPNFESIRNFDTKDFNCLTSDSNCINVSLSQNTSNEKRDMTALRREMSLDLERGGSKMSVDLTDASPPTSHNRHVINIHSSPNNSNFTHTSDNTSQSITPSEFGYQHLNRHSNVVSLESSPKSNAYDTLEQAFLNYEKAGPTNLINLASPNKSKAASPIKATISITYNLKSPTHQQSSKLIGCDKFSGDNDYEPVSIMDTENQEKLRQKPLLETSFDENMVYEQVRFFRSSVSEVNQLLNNGNSEAIKKNDHKNNLRQQQIVPDIVAACEKEVNSNLILNDDDSIFSCQKESLSESDDILMSENVDSLEVDDQNSLSLYENVEMRKPPSVYENIEISSGTQKPIVASKHQSIQLVVTEKPKRSNVTVTVKSASNFSVKQLATKFETSPVEALPPFDFSNRSCKKYDNVTNRDAPCYIRAKNHTKQLNKSAQITRSLDENAFVREFGGQTHIEDVTKSSQQISDKLEKSRRKSLEFARPKILNPPKHLPTLEDNESTIELCKIEGKRSSQLRLELQDGKENIPKAELKITPTTENRISLIQNNVLDVKTAVVDLDDRGSPNFPNLNVLSGVKLDRERIEKIKEERRHQLSEKYRTESFKSKSKTELREFVKDDAKYQSESLRVKSRSRGDVRQLQKEIDNLKGDEIMSFANRVRRISDEKNQNSNFGSGATIQQQVKQEELSAKTNIQKFERKSTDFVRDRPGLDSLSGNINTRNSISSTREKISPQFSIRDVAAMFESRSQNQQ